MLFSVVEYSLEGGGGGGFCKVLSKGVTNQIQATFKLVFIVDSS